MPVDGHGDVSGLLGLTEQRNFVEGQVLELSAFGFDLHFQGANCRFFGGREAFIQIVLGIGIHQKPDSAAVHPIDRKAALNQNRMAAQRFQHKPIPAKSDDGVGLRRINIAILLRQRF